MCIALFIRIRIRFVDLWHKLIYVDKLCMKFDSDSDIFCTFNTDKIFVYINSNFDLVPD